MAALRCHVWCRGLRAQRLARLTRPCSVLKAAWETLNLALISGCKRQCGPGGCRAVVWYRGYPCDDSDRVPLGVLPHAQLWVNVLCCVCLSAWELGHFCQGDLYTRSAPATQDSSSCNLLASCNSCSVHVGGVVTQDRFGPCCIGILQLICCGSFSCSYNTQRSLVA